MSTERQFITRLNNALAIPNPDEIKLPDGRTLVVRNWQSSLNIDELATITATFYVKDAEGFVGISVSTE